MAKLLLDELFYENGDTDEYMDDVIEFISKYFKDDIMIFELDNSLKTLLLERNKAAYVKKKIMRCGKYDIVQSNEIDSSDNTLNNSFLCYYSSEFICQINYLKDNFDNVIIFNAPERHKKIHDKSLENVYIINHIYTETDSNIGRFIQNDEFMCNINPPTFDVPLPNYELTHKYKELQDESINKLNLNERRAKYLEIAKEVLARNKYKHNQHITSLNPSIQYGIFSFNASSVIYAAIDTEHGAIEIFNAKGKHKDEYTYEGYSQNKQDKTKKHDIQVK